MVLGVSDGGVSFLNLLSEKRDRHLAVSACSRAAFWTWVPPFLLTPGPFCLAWVMWSMEEAKY